MSIPTLLMAMTGLLMVLSPWFSAQDFENPTWAKIAAAAVVLLATVLLTAFFRVLKQEDDMDRGMPAH